MPKTIVGKIIDTTATFIVAYDRLIFIPFILFILYMYFTPESKLTKYYEAGVSSRNERNKEFRELTGINPLGV